VLGEEFLEQPLRIVRLRHHLDERTIGLQEIDRRAHGPFRGLYRLAPQLWLPPLRSVWDKRCPMTAVGYAICHEKESSRNLERFDYARLIRQVREPYLRREPMLIDRTPHGERFRVEIPVGGSAGSAVVRSLWS
jgi:hypothetical protein